jgi:cytochrome P450
VKFFTSAQAPLPQLLGGLVVNAIVDTTDTIAADLIVAELVTTAGLADPYARLERLRNLGRAVPSTLGVVLTGYEDCQEALRNSTLLSDANATFEPLLGVQWRDNRALSLLANSMLFLEGGAHNRVRRLVASAFTPIAVASWQPTIEHIVEELLADVDQRLASGEMLILLPDWRDLFPSRSWPSCSDFLMQTPQICST